MENICTMTDKEVLQYLRLVDRKVDILANYSGVDWKPEYEEELKKIDQELAELRNMIDATRICFGKDSK